MDEQPTVLFLCTGNSCRSQMAEGLARHLLGDRARFLSAGTERHGLNRRAVTVMAERGVDISGHLSKTIEELPEVPVDLVITVCDAAREACPVFPSARRMFHRSFADPPALAAAVAAAGGSEEEILDCYRLIRDEIESFIATTLPTNLQEVLHDPKVIR